MELEVYNGQETPEAAAKALALAPRLISATQAFADKDPQDTAVAHNLAVAYYDDGLALLRAERWPEALAQLQKGLAIDERLAGQDPDNGEYVHSRGYFHASLGEARLRLNQLDAAADDARAARQALETVIAKDPDNSQPPRELVGVLILQGRIEMQRGRPADARSDFAQALAKLEALNARHISNRSDAKDLAFLHGALGPSGK
jgi:tetratricopeptide (TPR) repeat protein